MSDRLSWLGDLAPYLPPAFGALLGLRWAQNQTPTQKVLGFIGGFGAGAYFGPALGELLGLGPKATVGAGILIAVVGMDVIGGLIVAATAFRNDPLGSFKGWWGAWFGRGGTS